MLRNKTCPTTFVRMTVTICGSIQVIAKKTINLKDKMSRTDTFKSPLGLPELTLAATQSKSIWRPSCSARATVPLFSPS